MQSCPTLATSGVPARNDHAPLSLAHLSLDGRAGASQRRLDRLRFRRFKAAHDRTALRPEAAQELRRKLDDGLGADIGDRQIDAAGANRIGRSREKQSAGPGATEILAG